MLNDHQAHLLKILIGRYQKLCLRLTVILVIAHGSLRRTMGIFLRATFDF